MVILPRNEIRRSRIIAILAFFLGVIVLVRAIQTPNASPGVRIVLGVVALAAVVMSLVHLLSSRGPSKIILFHQGDHTILATNHLHQANRLRFFRDVLGEHSFAFSDEQRERWSGLEKAGFHAVFNVRDVRKTYLLALSCMTFDEVYVLDHLGRWDYYNCHNTSEPTYSSRGVSPFQDDSVLPDTKKQPAT